MKVKDRLQQRFPNIKDLATALEELGCSLRKGRQLTKFCKQVLVAPLGNDSSRNLNETNLIASFCPSSTFHDGLTWTIKHMIKDPKNSWSTTNILCVGYMLHSDSDNRDKLISTGENQAVEFLLQDENWYALYEKFGPRIFYVLVSCAVFSPIREVNGSYLQLSGQPLSDISLNMTGSVREKDLIFKSDLHILQRAVISKRLVVHRSPIRDSSGSAVFRFKPNFHLELPYRVPRDSELVNALSVAMPLEFGIRMKLLVENGKYTKFVDTEGIRRSQYPRTDGDLIPDHIPTHLKQIFNKIFRRHFNLPYGTILRSICRNRDTYSSISQVSRFSRTVIRRMLPKDLFGSTKNWNVILRAVDRFVHMRSSERFQLVYALEGLSTKEIKWFPKCNDGSEEQNNQKFLQHQKVLLQLIYWVFRHILVPLLSACFYVTSHTSDYNSLYYYRHDVWDYKSKLACQRFINMKLKPVRKETTSIRKGNSSLGTARMRIVAKSSGGFRAITAMGSKNKKMETINKRLATVFQVLNQEVQSQNLENGRIRSISEFVNKLKHFRIKRAGPFYCVKMDINKCFDTIPAALAYQCVEKLLQKETYIIQDLKNVDFSKPRLFSRTEHRARKHSVVCGNASSQVVSREHVLKLLHEHLHSSFIRVGNEYYRQTKGIPQGSVLSTILCNIVYDAMEEEYIQPLCSSSTSKLFRYVDDFLFVSTSKEKAQKFLTAMQLGFPKYGARTSARKTQTTWTSNDISFLGITFASRTLKLREPPLPSPAPTHNMGPRPSCGFNQLLTSIRRQVKTRIEAYKMGCSSPRWSAKPKSIRHLSSSMAQKYLFACRKSLVNPLDAFAVNKLLQRLYIELLKALSYSAKTGLYDSKTKGNVEKGIRQAIKASPYRCILTN